MLAISAQDVDSHDRFSAKHGGFEFPLLADTDKAVAALYGTLGPIGFPRRSVFIVDGDGIVRYAHRAIAGLTYRPVSELVAVLAAPVGPSCPTSGPIGPHRRTGRGSASGRDAGLPCEPVFAAGTTRVLGIDPGLTRCGYAVVDGRGPGDVTAVALGVIRTPAADPLPQRLAALRAELAALIDEFRPPRSASSTCSSRSTCARR